MILLKTLLLLLLKSSTFWKLSYTKPHTSVIIFSLMITYSTFEWSPAACQHYQLHRGQSATLISWRSSKCLTNHINSWIINSINFLYDLPINHPALFHQFLTKYLLLFTYFLLFNHIKTYLTWLWRLIINQIDWLSIKIHCQTNELIPPLMPCPMD